MSSRLMTLIAATVLLALGHAPAGAADVSSLKGKFTFDWHGDPASEKCEKIGDKLLEKLASAAFSCDLAPKTNSASGHPVQICTKASGIGEYLIFDTRAFCEDERETQASAE